SSGDRAPPARRGSSATEPVPQLDAVSVRIADLRPRILAFAHPRPPGDRDALLVQIRDGALHVRHFESHHAIAQVLLRGRGRDGPTVLDQLDRCPTEIQIGEIQRDAEARAVDPISCADLESEHVGIELHGALEVSGHDLDVVDPLEHESLLGRSHPPSRRTTSARLCFVAMSSGVSPSGVGTARSAPLSRRRRARARSPLNAASCSGVWPAGDPRLSTGDPRAMRSRTMSGRRSARGPAAAALIARLASEFRATARTSALASRSASTVSRWPKNAARWRGGQPSWDHCPTIPGFSASCRRTSATSPRAQASKKLARAPCSSRRRTMSYWPVYVAIRRGELPRSSRAFARSGPAATSSATVSASPRRMAPSRSAIPLTRFGPAGEPGGCRLCLQEGRRGLQRLVPRPGEAAFRALFRERPLPVPLAPGLLVVHLEAVSVGIREIDAEGDRVVGDADRDVLVLEPLVHLGKVLEVRHAPGDVIQANLLFLRPRGLFTHLEERDVVSVSGV